MKDLLPPISPHFLTNKKGEKIGVFMDIQDYKLLVEKIEDLYLGNIAKAIKDRKEESKPLEEIEKELKN